MRSVLLSYFKAYNTMLLTITCVFLNPETFFDLASALTILSQLIYLEIAGGRREPSGGGEVGGEHPNSLLKTA